MELPLGLNLAWPDVRDVYNVKLHGCSIGRIWLATDRLTTDEPWEWFISLPLILPKWCKGCADSLDNAMSLLTRALGRVVTNTPSQRVRRAFELALCCDEHATRENSGTLLTKLMNEVIALSEDPRFSPMANASVQRSKPTAESFRIIEKITGSAVAKKDTLPKPQTMAPETADDPPKLAIVASPKAIGSGSIKLRVSLSNHNDSYSPK